MTNTMPMKTSVVVNGKTWYLFSAEFSSDDGVYRFPFYAISHEHAEIVLRDIKETAKVVGQVCGFEP